MAYGIGLYSVGTYQSQQTTTGPIDDDTADESWTTLDSSSDTFNDVQDLTTSWITVY